MKRKTELETLSFEHHDALVIALRLKKGLKINANLQAMVDYALSVYQKHLLHHFKQEEQILVEPLQSQVEAKAAVQQMLREHQRFAELISFLKNHNTDHAKLVQEFAELLEQHIRFEERTLFPLAEKLIPDNKLKEIGDYLHQEHRPIDKSWPEPFWQD